MYTQQDRELAQRIWKAPNALALSEADRTRGLELKFIVWPYASNLCNDVAKGHGVAHGHAI